MKPSTPDQKRILRSTSRDSDVSSGRRVSFAAQAEVKNAGTAFRNRGGATNTTTTAVPIKPFDGGTPRSYTPETFSDASSATDGDSGFYEVIEYDPSKQIMSFNLNKPKEPPQTWDGVEVDEEEMVEAEVPFEIEDNTPAAEALRASASVRVSRVGKAARAVHMQAVRRLVKRATWTGKQGVVKGQPERLPPRQLQDGEVKPEELSDLEEEDEESEHSDHDPSSQHFDGEPVVPDDVVQGTAEAGKKGTCVIAQKAGLSVINSRPSQHFVVAPFPTK
jgi:hypothetical protein